MLNVPQEEKYYTVCTQQDQAYYSTAWRQSIPDIPAYSLRIYTKIDPIYILGQAEWWHVVPPLFVFVIFGPH